MAGFKVDRGCIRGHFTEEMHKEGTIRQLTDADLKCYYITLCGSLWFSFAVLCG